MKPLIILIVTFLISLLCIKLIYGNYQWAIAGCIGMSVMILFTGVAHFIYTKGVTMMLPEFIPQKTFIVYLTGIIEIAAAVGLLLPYFRTTTGWLLIIFFVMILPSNIYAGMKQVDYENADYSGNGLNYLWVRVPLQIFFIAWIYVFAIMQMNGY